jgi:5'-nucleotidase
MPSRGMFKAPLDLKKARVLICNDDGINAPGIKRLEKVARGFAKEVWVVSPEVEQSGAAHSLTLRQPLRIRQVSKWRFAISGTPTDCVLLAVNQIMKACKPDLVLSGFNQGANVGEDMTYSGTIAVTMEATLLGIPAIALSQQVDEKLVDEKSAAGRVYWSTAECYAPGIIKFLTKQHWPHDVLMNVNFPPVPPDKVEGFEVAREGRRKVGDEVVEGWDPRGRPYYWIGAQHGADRYHRGTDLNAMARNMICVTPVTVDLTHHGMMGRLRRAAKGFKLG